MGLAWVLESANMYLSLPLTVVWDLVRSFPSLSFNVLICEMGIIRVPTPQSCSENEMRQCMLNFYHNAWHVLDTEYMSAKKEKTVSPLSNFHNHCISVHLPVCTNNNCIILD